MVKLDYDRDYYADLELPPTADIQDIKTQFRKLALKWHPDRNHGREEEAKAKFVIIQSAQEILLDRDKKAKYDAERRTRQSRYPTASGVRGNPWQNVSSQYPPPPKRPPMPTRPVPTRPTTGASRYSGWVPPDTKAGRDSNSDNMQDNVRAWDRMRPGNKANAYGETAGSSKPSPRRARNPDPQATPRSDAQRQKAEAAFGTRRTGFVPTSPLGDEPPVTNRNYSTTKTHSSLFEEARPASSNAGRPSTSSAYVDPLSKQFSQTFLDTRHSTPYMSHVGEKTNLFEGVNRAKSMRVPSESAQRRNGNLETPISRRRSASAGHSGQQNSPQSNASSSGSSDDASDSPEFTFQPRSEGRPKAQPESKSAPATATFSSVNSSTSSINTANATVNSETPSARGGGPSVYGAPFLYPQVPKLHTPSCTRALLSKSRIYDGPSTPRQNWQPASAWVEGVSSYSQGLNPFEGCLHSILDSLVHKKNTPRQHTPEYTERGVSASETSPSSYSSSVHQTNTSCGDSFSMPVDDDVFEPTSARKQTSFSRSSADNINTRFVAGETSNGGFRFNAGAPSEDDLFSAAKRHHREKLRSHRSHSPMVESATSAHNPTTDVPQPSVVPQQNDAGHTQQRMFNPEQWAEKIGVHNFVPPRTTASPTRPLRKKAKPVKMTAGTAGLVDEDETSSEDNKTRPPTAADQVDRASSPNAMDLDTPPLEPTPSNSAGAARNINVEPSNPDWRAGTMNGVKTRLDAGSKVPPPSNGNRANAAGSEDSEEFLGSNFSDFVKVEPFAPPAPESRGLGSMGDLKSNLPFESKASSKLPVTKEKPKPLHFPIPPTAPGPPLILAAANIPVPATTWAKYAQDFNAYMVKWADFNGRVTDHFAARRRQVENTRTAKGGFDWVNARDDAAIGEYLQWLAEDRDVRQKWMLACEEHEQQVRLFMKFREKAKQ